jgi:hypothetical protein
MHFSDGGFPVLGATYLFSTGISDTVPRRFFLQAGINTTTITRHHYLHFHTFLLEHLILSLEATCVPTYLRHDTLCHLFQSWFYVNVCELRPVATLSLSKHGHRLWGVLSFETLTSGPNRFYFTSRWAFCQEYKHRVLRCTEFFSFLSWLYLKQSFLSEIARRPSADYFRLSSIWDFEYFKFCKRLRLHILETIFQLGKPGRRTKQKRNLTIFHVGKSATSF